jgi:hypothetical protein
LTSQSQRPTTSPHFSPVRHVLEHMAGKRLSLAARHLAVVMASRLALTPDGRRVIWRGRASLAEISGLSIRAVTAARGQLLDAGIFCAHRQSEVTLANGKRHHIKRGLLIVELVMDPAAFVAAREKSRAVQAVELERRIDEQTGDERLALQKECITDQITRDEYNSRLETLRDSQRPKWAKRAPKDKHRAAS